MSNRVVCVDASDGNYTPWQYPRNATLHGLTKGRIYHVRREGEYRGQPCLWLAEIKRPLCRHHPEAGEPGFHRARFRYIVEKTTDISALTAILDGTKIKELAG